MGLVGEAMSAASVDCRGFDKVPSDSASTSASGSGHILDGGSGAPPEPQGSCPAWLQRTPSPSMLEAQVGWPGPQVMQSAAMPHMASQHPQEGYPRSPLWASGLAPTMLEAAAGSFSELGAWSASCGRGPGVPEEAARSTSRSEPPAAGGARRGGSSSSSSLPSAGSKAHASGKCKPCAFIHRPVGCAEGLACSFCHLCQPGEKKRRQKQKYDTLRKRRAEKMAACAAAEEKEDEDEAEAGRVLLLPAAVVERGEARPPAAPR